MDIESVWLAQLFRRYPLRASDACSLICAGGTGSIPGMANEYI